MTNNKILSPKVEEYILVVSIPIESPIIIFDTPNISDAEKFFVSRVARERDHDKKVKFDRARALLKWAYCCNGRLVEMHDGDDKQLIFTFSFDTRKSMIEFLDNMDVNVNGATMK